MGIAYGTYVAMTVTNLQSLANDSSDPFAGWQSDVVDNRTAGVHDYQVRIHLPTANTAPAGDAAVFVYVIPWQHDGSSWVPMANFGSTTQPTGSEGTANISDPNSMRGRVFLPYKVAQQIINGEVSIADVCPGGLVPDGWSLAIRNASGAALSTGCVVSYRPITVS